MNSMFPYLPSLSVSSPILTLLIVQSSTICKLLLFEWIFEKSLRWARQARSQILSPRHKQEFHLQTNSKILKIKNANLQLVTANLPYIQHVEIAEIDTGSWRQLGGTHAGHVGIWRKGGKLISEAGITLLRAGSTHMLFGGEGLLDWWRGVWLSEVGGKGFFHNKWTWVSLLHIIWVL